MEILEEFDVFEVKEKIGTLAPDVWMINSYCEKKDYYRVQLRVSETYRPIGIIPRETLEEAIENGACVLHGKLKLKERPHKEKIKEKTKENN